LIDPKAAAYRNWPNEWFYFSPRGKAGGKRRKIQIGFVAWFIVDLQGGRSFKRPGIVNFKRLENV